MRYRAGLGLRHGPIPNAVALLTLLALAGCTGASEGGPGQVEGLPAAAAESTRLTYYQAAASIATSRYQIVEDPSCTSGPGCLTDPTTGKHYRRTDQGPQAQDPPTAAGDGYSQMDILAHDGAFALIDVNLYVIDRTFSQFSLTPLGRIRADAAVADGLWIHPAELARLEREGLPGMLVARGPYQVGQTTYDTLSFWSEVGRGRFSHTYDVETGLLVAANTSTAGATSPFRVANEDPPQGNTELAMSRLVGVRQRRLPGLDGTRPDWLTTGRELRYAGSYNWINPIDPSTGNLTYPVEHIATVGDVGTDWAALGTRTLVPQLGMDNPVNVITGPTGLYWYAASGLATMTQGQQLDSDPVTGERVTVAFVGGDRAGRTVVVIESQLAGVSSRAAYDVSSGVLTAYDTTQASTGTTVSLQLQEMR